MGRGHIDNYFRPTGIAGTLSNGGTLQTGVEDEDGRPIRLVEEDVSCSECGALISTDAFGSAPYGRVLANMKATLGETYCPACHMDQC
jgi:hypothetical protein